MKKDIIGYVSRCLTCQKVKSELKRSDGLIQTLEIPVWQWDVIPMDLVVGFPRTTSANNAFSIGVDRLNKFAIFIPMNYR